MKTKRGLENGRVGKDIWSCTYIVEGETDPSKVFSDRKACTVAQEDIKTHIHTNKWINGKY